MHTRRLWSLCTSLCSIPRSAAFATAPHRVAQTKMSAHRSLGPSAAVSGPANAILSWSDIGAIAAPPPNETDVLHGAASSSRAALRLFGHAESEIRVTLIRDQHSWCPYCQKVWFWLEESRVPYRTRKAAMYCYGDNERTFPWFPKAVPSENFPALMLDGRVMSESDDLIIACEEIYGPMGGAGAPGMHHPRVVAVRQLERKIFSAWCNWLCRAAPDARTEALVAARFDAVAAEVDAALSHKVSASSSAASGGADAGQAAVGPFFLGATAPTAADAIFAPYLERMNASLFYYKGYRMRQRHANIDRWFRALEQRPSYRGMRSDFHTHCHDLPPQMGSCVPNGTAEQKAIAAWVDYGPWFDAVQSTADGGSIVQRLIPAFATPDPEFPAPLASAASHAAAAPSVGSVLALPTRHAALTEAITRTWLHAPTLVAINGADADRARVDEALRCALTRMAAAARRAAATNEAVDDPLPAEDEASALPAPPAGSAPALRYLLDRVNVPRDMSLHAARHLRHFLERTARAADAIGAKSSAAASASVSGTRERAVPIPLRHRRDQDPHAFVVAKKEKPVSGDQKCVSV